MRGSIGKLVRNTARVLRDPGIGVDYAGWLISAARHANQPTRTLLDGIEIGGFVNFSEYHSVPRFISAQERRFFEGFAFGAGSIIDVGANVGLVSLLLARRYPDTVIAAFEPNPTTFAALGSNISRNRANHVTAYQLALADKVGSVMFDTDPIKRGTASITADNTANSQAVPATTLDAFATERGLARIGLLKIDVEGFETLVLAGAKHVLAEVRPSAIYFEVCPVLTERSGFPASGPAQTLVDAGYDLFRFGDDGALQSATPAETAVVSLENWLATPR